MQQRVARELGFKLVGHRLELYGVPVEARAQIALRPCGSDAFTPVRPARLNLVQQTAALRNSSLVFRGARGRRWT